MSTIFSDTIYWNTISCLEAKTWHITFSVHSMCSWLKCWDIFFYLCPLRNSSVSGECTWRLLLKPDARAHSSSALFKYFKWDCCGAITWLLDKHQVMHRADSLPNLRTWAGTGNSHQVLTSTSFYTSGLKKKFMTLLWTMTTLKVLWTSACSGQSEKKKNETNAKDIYRNSTFTAISTKRVGHTSSNLHKSMPTYTHERKKHTHSESNPKH